MPTELGLDQLASVLIAARRDATPITTTKLPRLTIAEGYQVQAELTRQGLAVGEQVVGWKVGLTSGPAMAAFEASEPIAGPMFASSVLRSGDSVDRTHLCQPRVEGEILIEIGEPPDASCSDDALLKSISSIRPAIEVADSRIAGWPSAAPLAVADYACCGVVVVGPPFDPRGLDLGRITMELAADGAVVSTGVGADCLGSPLAVYRWFLAQAARLGWRLSPGDLLLTGALGPAVPAGLTNHFQAKLSGLCQVDLFLAGDGNV